jgi:hypothetical protein
MKKTILSIIAVIGILGIVAGIMIVRSVKPPLAAEPQLPPADQLGFQTTFAMTYRSNTGTDDDVPPKYWYGLGHNEQLKSAFIQAVRQQAENDLFIGQCYFFRDAPRQLLAVEYKDRKALALYYDVDGDGKLAPAERIVPGPGRDQSPAAFDFLTPDFTVTAGNGKTIPFRVLVRVRFHGDTEDLNQQPNLIIASAGWYEGTAQLNGKTVRLILSSELSERGYTVFRRSSMGLVDSTQDMQQWYDRAMFSSLMLHDGKFYRLVPEGSDAVGGSLKVHLYEDKSPRGRFALNISGSEGFKSRLSSGTLLGDTDRTILFDIDERTHELPAGRYMISSGTIQFGRQSTDEYYAPFRDLPAFTVRGGNTVTVELGKPRVQVRVVKEKKRYDCRPDDVESLYTQNTPLYIDAAFIGQAGETYSTFYQYVQRETYRTREYLNPHLKIVDETGTQIVSQDLEYG